MAKRRPELLEAWLLWGACAWRLGDAETARRAVHQALEIRPNSPIALIIKGEMRLAQDDFDEARELFAQAIQLDDSSYLAHRGMALLDVARHSPRALKSLGRLAEIGENEWQRFESLELRAIAAIESGALDQALADVARILAFRPSADCQNILDCGRADGSPGMVRPDSNSLLLRPSQMLKSPLQHGGLSAATAQWRLRVVLASALGYGAGAPDRMVEPRHVPFDGSPSSTATMGQALRSAFNNLSPSSKRGVRQYASEVPTPPW